ncbi:lipoprotein insertase outer membrane protein LolB [Stutzerimonas stutzeri]|uniref:lipoprotein insertase outer membrane protein LolB n=1 Tax=Stutzerimonas stutzeri TaxID=316 RepID=UPI00210D4DEC|nr:lipoprotein insertase outer membrane protein LolB [Stutzerimonas stutzeri]MCQ4243207.1 lipoprotein insertase outer membrane protein LolB [Stutzerimonas stutzeri]
MKPMRNLLIPLLALLLAGCAGFGPQESLEGPGNAEAWQAHKARISHIDGWQISGKIGIRAPQDSGSGTLFWLQRQDYFDIRLSGPLGRGATRLTGRPDAVTLEVAGQGRFEAQSPEALVESQLGWQLPVSHLLWWIRGLPAPDSRSRITLDGSGRLATLQQDDWDIQYLNYEEENGLVLPSRIKLEGRNLQITLVIKDWQPRQLGH